MKQIIAFVCAAVLLSDCAWYQGHKSQVAATGALLAKKAATIAEAAVFSQASNLLDLALKGNNVSGFGDALRQIEGSASSNAVGQIPDAIMKLREIWLGPQTHYTDMAAQLGQLLKTQLAGKTTAEQTAIIEAIIKGLQAPPNPVVLQGP